MRSHAALLAAIACLFSCDFSEPPELADTQRLSSELSGTYSGVFFRSNPLIDSKTSHVSITFNNNNFSGESEIEKYPALCHGEFRAQEGAIEFDNECYFTAEFDWTMILSGPYKYKQSGDSLFIHKQIDESTSDHYLLVLENFSRNQ